MIELTRADACTSSRSLPSCTARSAHGLAVRSQPLTTDLPQALSPLMLTSDACGNALYLRSPPQPAAQSPCRPRVRRSDDAVARLWPPQATASSRKPPSRRVLVPRRATADELLESWTRRSRCGLPPVSAGRAAVSLGRRCSAACEHLTARCVTGWRTSLCRLVDSMHDRLTFRVGFRHHVGAVP